jgi:hypothetical protein
MRIFRDLLWTAVAVLAFVALLEVGMRLAGVRYEYSFYESDPVIYTTYRPNADGWEVKEGENHVRINSLGMRDRERRVLPAPGAIRIALLGDSLVAATQVPLEKTMAQVLEGTLNTRLGSSGHSFEVLNFAQGGSTLAQQYLMLRNRVWDFQPQIVIVFVSPISVPTCSRRLDTVAAPKPFYLIREGRLVPDPRSHPPAAASLEARRRNGKLKNLMNQYRLLLLLRQAIGEGAEKVAKVEAEIVTLASGRSAEAETEADDERYVYPVDIWFREHANPEVEQAWQVAEGLLGRIAEETRQHGAELWLGSIGTEVQENPDVTERTAYLKTRGYEAVGYSEERFEALAKREGIPYLGMSPRMLAYAERNNVSVRGFFNTPPNRGHWNQVGNAAAAGIVFGELFEHSAVIRSLRAKGLQANRSGPDR